MQRTTIMLPEDLKARAEEKSRQQGVSLGEFVREALTKLLNDINNDTEDSFFSDNAIFTGDAPKDLSSHHDDYIYGEQP
ncbi:MAG: ribbon-helix-helix domain-containing protein [Desulfobacteraceae bacterium]|nr:ribbon-helix-helix domain-containing protein [Desulfobacteraceae bacterium]